jgi:ABC-type phosphate transport system ATPase subunit
MWIEAPSIRDSRFDPSHISVTTAGSIRVLDLEVHLREVELAEVGKQVGVVFQRPISLPLLIQDKVILVYLQAKSKEKVDTADLPLAGRWSP